MTDWALGSHYMVGDEFLTNVSKVFNMSYFPFTVVKVQDCHGGPRRAMVLHD